MAKAGFGRGCHWCTEGVFHALRGVAQVDQGFVQSDAPPGPPIIGHCTIPPPKAGSCATRLEVDISGGRQ